MPNNRRYERITYNSSTQDLPFNSGNTDPIPETASEPAPEGQPVADGADFSSAPMIDWSLNEGPADPSHRGSVPWGFASVLVTAVSTLLAIHMLRKRQAVTVVTSGTRTGQEST
ncbi:MAG: hypothetical protein VB858_20725 [Planctomycetaceae bacterium]